MRHDVQNRWDPRDETTTTGEACLLRCWIVIHINPLVTLSLWNQTGWCVCQRSINNTDVLVMIFPTDLLCLMRLMGTRAGIAVTCLLTVVVYSAKRCQLQWLSKGRWVDNREHTPFQKAFMMMMMTITRDIFQRDNWVFPKCLHWIGGKLVSYPGSRSGLKVGGSSMLKKIIWTCHLFCKTPRWYHITRVAERIFKLNQIRVSVT